jgi:oxalate decarboxylase/phosphoglucose isomerase-like protein (cupin superfamily)
MFYKCGLKKIVFGLPAIIAFALICYISYVFMFLFMPDRFQEYHWLRSAIELVFTWFSAMTLVSIVATAASDPGYISNHYKHPLTNEGNPPLNLLRVYNMKMFQTLKLYDFAKVTKDEESLLNGDIELQEVSA